MEKYVSDKEVADRQSKEDSRFDLIFEGTMEEQEYRANRFRTGLSRKLQAECAELAENILYNRESARTTLKQIKEYEDAHAAMVNDPRGVALKAWVEKRDQDRAAGEIAGAILDILSHRQPAGHQQ